MPEPFIETFGVNKKAREFRSLIHNQGWVSGRDGRFDKGHEPWNKGTKGLTEANSGSFKKGMVPINRRDIGDERICPKDGYILIKIAENNPYTDAKTRFKAKHVWMWEKAHGLVPENHTVSFIDGNKLNCTMDNLELLSRSALLRLNQSGIKDLPEELRPSMRTVAKLQAAIGLRTKDVD